MAVSRDRFARSQFVFGATLAVGLLSIATGIVNMSGPTRGPLAAYLPPMVVETAAFTGALTGFLIVLSAFGLRRGLRAAWYAVVVLLPVTALQGFVQASVYSYPLVAASVVAFLSALLAYDRYDRALRLSTTQWAAALALGGVLAYGTVGTYALREQFTNVETLLDAFYYTLVTASTVGYGDMLPASQVARVFALSVLVLGVASFGIALGALIGPAIEARFAAALGRMTQSQLESLDNHVIVAGYGDLTEPILEELRADGVAFLVVTPDQSLGDTLSNRGMNVLVADPSDEEAFDRGGLDRARAVVAATNDDGEDALAILTARQLRPDIHIVAAASERENEPKLKRAGADTVISPAVIGGRLLVRSALGDREAETVADEVLEND
ncbi:NAD-binding protein [Halocalculus aciditolerans]|uniref:Potassium channel protein n=1 Tax=Halocalculus aciditolerans TaxID=1383812 RepID=A0A830FIX7_9EURY|nr:NAD-binding protein [Halocalculus aciditolerans]GGL51573.1 potassium channel protein [Halocalculus aciditolerans]